LLLGFNRAVLRINQLRKIVSLPEVVSTTTSEQGHEVHVIRYGRLVAAGTTPHAAQISELVAALLLSAEQVEPRGILPAKSLANYDDAPAAIGEAELLLNLEDIRHLIETSAELLPFS
jgi:hypothetical protein